MTHSGEDGFLLYVPNEYGLYTYDTICNAGKNFGLINIGFYALRSLRIEKFFPYWGIDILSNMTPLECGKDQRVCYEKSNFIGKEALLSQKRKGASRRLVNFEMRDCDINKDWWITGGEPIYLNGNHVGNVTSSAYGFSVNNIVLIGNVDFAVTPFETPQKAIDSSTFKIKVNNQWFTAKASLYSRFIKPVEDIID
ncbi:hypothetical protein A3Q56_06840 [Intoshia linei]|uniref:Uncharacterized protein n=1 Tax=Intoshia linei TaxID=1819745 RepID=A0A177ATW8_9BILA|nr:hypothetical protein A3Q56_06840 [Intoshia linei]